MITVNNIKDLENYCAEDVDLKKELEKLIQKAVDLEKKSDEIALAHAKTGEPAQSADYKEAGQLLTNFLEFRSYFIERCKGRGINTQFHLGSYALYALHKKLASQ